MVLQIIRCELPLRKPTRTTRRDLIRIAGNLSGLWLTAPRLLASPLPQPAASDAPRPAPGPKPYGPLPSLRQRAWHELET
jgi:hypothetical protein